MPRFALSRPFLLRHLLCRPVLFWIQATLLCCGVLLTCYSYANDKGPVVPKGKGDVCVAETSLMRRNHMDYLLHQRDRTVVQGVRDEAFSLVECVDCHARQDAQGKAIRVDAEGEFCQSCHTYAAVKIDCFSCHAAVPGDNSASGEETDGHQQDNAELQIGTDSLTTLNLRLAEFLDGHRKH